MHVLARRDKLPALLPEKPTLKQLDGLRISLGPPRSGTALIAQAVLREHGVEESRAVFLSVPDTLARLNEGEIDAAFFVSFLLVRRCPHVEWVAVFGAVMGFMVFAVPCATQAVFWGGAGALVSPRFLGSVIPVTLVSTCLGMAAAVAWRSICRLFDLRLVEEKVCSNCGYRIEPLPSNRCPECGKSFDISTMPTNAPVIKMTGSER